MWNIVECCGRGQVETNLINVRQLEEMVENNPKNILSIFGIKIIYFVKFKSKNTFYDEYTKSRKRKKLCMKLIFN